MANTTSIRTHPKTKELVEGLRKKVDKKHNRNITQGEIVDSCVRTVLDQNLWRNF